MPSRRWSSPRHRRHRQAVPLNPATPSDRDVLVRLAAARDRRVRAGQAAAELQAATHRRRERWTRVRDALISALLMMVAASPLALGLTLLATRGMQQDLGNLGW